MGDLGSYREKRHFDRTPEPAGTAAGDAAGERLYVIQKHAARQLHYDLRLELGGVLLSWAVPKGPSLDPSQRHLAVHVEDHPVEYGSFEGTIPTGEYGAGTVMVWDRGTWEPVEDPEAGLEKGHLKFELRGDKLQGRFALVRMKPREGERRENWLLIKDRDEYARPLAEYDVVEARPESVASGRDLAQIAAGVDTAGGDAGPLAASGTAAPKVAPRPGMTPGPLPLDAPMQLATLVEAAPEGPDWVHEVKYDGYRLRVAVEEGRARILTRTSQDWTDRFPDLARAAEALPVRSALLDGEAVVFGQHGVPDFGALQDAVAKRRTGHVAYMAFDLLYLDGFDVREAPLVERKELLRALVAAAGHDSPIRFADHITGRGPDFHRETCTLALEGSVSKRADKPYRAGRTRDWEKVKCLKRQEFVVGGFTEGAGSREGFGALLLGYHGADGALEYAGRVGTGFAARDLRELRKRFEAMETGASPFAPSSRVPERGAHWVEPTLVAEVSFQEWTRDGLIRHPSFHGLREDKPAEEVVLEGDEPAGGGSEAVRGGGSQTADPQASAAQAASPQAPDPDPKAPAASGSSAEEVAGVRITNPDKPLYAGGDAAGAVTKLELARYYEAIAEYMLPYVARRPLTLVRCPHGHEGTCFYQKHPVARGFPAPLRTIEITDKGGPATYFFAEDTAGIVSLVQLGALEIHTWQSSVDSVEQPDQIVLDLDPGPGVSWRQIAESALVVRDALSAIGLAAFAKSTGGKGLHVVVPIVPGAGFEDVRALSKAFVDRIAAHDPDAFTAKMAKAARPGRVFVDYLRNAHGATAVCAYSTRARDGAPVSVPVSWEELDAAKAPFDFGIATTIERLSKLAEDPWRDFEGARAPLTDALFAALGVPRQSAIDVK